MRSLKLKVCGMKEPVNISEVTRLSPDYMGFIFYKKSRRYVGNDFDIDGVKAKKVGVFVDEELSNVVSTASRYRLDLVQLHGSEPVQYCKYLHDRGLDIIKAFSVSANFDFDLVEKCQPYVKSFLFDTKGELPGGNGVAFDWSLLENYHGDTPFFLSGGLNPENIPMLDQLTHPMFFGIDINSGFEIEPGVKDVEKIKDLVIKLGRT